MVITNKKRATVLKRLFFLTSLVMAIFILVMFLLDNNLYAILTGASFLLWFFIFQLFDFQYVEFIFENEKILLRYFPAVKFGKKDYNSIEFSQKVLHDVQYERTLFGLATDIILIVKTKRGIAEYPSVSLAAVPNDDYKKIKNVFNEILEK